MDSGCLLAARCGDRDVGVTGAGDVGKLTPGESGRRQQQATAKHAMNSLITELWEGSTVRTEG